MSSKKKKMLAQVKQNKTNRVENKEKKYEKTQRSKSDKAYIEGDYKSSVSKRSYGIKKQIAEGNDVKGYGKNYVDTKGMSRSSYNKLQKGENPYEAKYVYTGKPSVIKNKDGSMFTTRNRFMTNDEKKSYNETGTLNDQKYAPKQKYAIMSSANPSGTKFTDHLNTFKADGLATAKANQREGQHIKNAGQWIAGGLKDILDIPIDVMKGADYAMGQVTGALSGALEQSGNVFTSIAEGKNNINKGLIKRNMEESRKESDKTGWGHGFGKYFNDVADRSDKKYNVKQTDREKTKRENILNIAGLGADILNPITVEGALKPLAKGVKSSFNDMVKGTADLSTGFVPKELTNLKGQYGNKLRKATGASDDVFYNGKSNNYLGNTEIDHKLNKGYDNAINKSEPIKTGKTKLDGFLSRLNSNDIVPITDGINKSPISKTSMFDEAVERVNTRETKQKLNSFSGRQEMFNGINPIKLQDEGGELNNLMGEILRYKSKLGFKDKKGGLLNNKIQKLPKGKREELVNALNDNLFDGQPVISNNISYGYLREFAEKFKNSTPEQFYNEVLPKISSSLTDPSHYDKGKYLKEFGGIGEYQKYVDETERLVELSRNEKLSNYESVKLNREIIQRKEKIAKRNKLAQEIYPIEPEQFYKQYGDNVGNNPLGIKDSEWKNNNQIKELTDNGVLDDLAKRTEYDPQQTFKPSPTEVANEDKSYLNKQMWDIVASNVGEGQRVGYHKNAIKGIEVEISKLTKELEDALENLDFSKTKEINDSIKKLNVDKQTKQDLVKAMGREFNKVKELVSGDHVSQQKLIEELLGDTYKQFPHLKTNGEGIKKVYSEKAKRPFDYLKPKGDVKDVSVNIARRIAEQHGINEPIAMMKREKGITVVDKKLLRDNKVEIQKLAELRVLQSFTQGGTGKVMDDAVGLLIKEHMNNMRRSLPNDDYKKLVSGVQNYIGEMRKAYASYKNPTGKMQMNPLQRIGSDNLYTKKGVQTEESKALFGMDLQKLARRFVDGELDEIANNLETLGSVGENVGKMNNPFDEFLKSKNSLSNIDEKIASRMTPERMEQILGKPLNEILDSSNISKPPKIAGEEITPGWRLNADKGSVGTDVDMNKIGKSSDEIAVAVEELSREGIDASKKPPKTKPDNMSPNLYKKWLNTWKKGVTVYNPGWHVQNFFQNKGQNYLALGNKAFAPQTEARKVLKELQNGKNMSPIASKAQELNVLGEFGEDFISQNTGLMSKIDNSKIMKKLEENEQTARLHHWLTQIDNGMNEEDALKSVNKYLFDYSGKNDKGYDKFMKNVDPFWTFHKNNAKLMVDSGLRHPSRMGNIRRGVDGLDNALTDENRQNEESSYGRTQLPGATYHDDVSNADFNYMYKQQTLPEFEDGIPTTQEDFENKMNPGLRVILQTLNGEGNFGNKITTNDEAEWGETTVPDRIKEILMELNPFAPTLFNTIDKSKSRQEKADNDKVGQEITNKQILNDWIKYITGHKGNWYRNM